MDKIPRYKAVIDTENSEEQGVNFISLVESPATEEQWVALSKEKEKEKEVKLSLDVEKQIVTGAVLIPKQEIYRITAGEEWLLIYDEDCIEQIAINFFKKLKGVNKTTLEHSSDKFSNVTIYESWIKTTENDKSNDLLKKNYPKGTWFVTMKIEDQVIWNRIKEGKYKGFSIEGLFDIHPINDKIVKQNKTIKNQLGLSEIFNEVKKISTI
jgi:hypothetical protein